MIKNIPYIAFFMEDNFDFFGLCFPQLEETNFTLYLSLLCMVNENLFILDQNDVK